jgi:membrane peptidoglycan carboxypeptidase
VTLQQALARSLNTVSVRLTLEVGPDTVAAFAHRLGVADVPDHPGPSIALGAYEVTPLELAAGYQVFQTGGGRTTPYLISEIRTTHGDLIWSHDASAPTPVLDPLFATRMVNMLKTVITSGTGTGANIGRPAAGKTGTSQDWRDAWFVGFTPDILTAVWVGNDGGAPMAKVTGGELPAQIWRKYMTVAEAKLPPRDFPWLVQEPNMPAGSVSVADQSADEEPSPYEDQPDMGDDGARADPGQPQAGPVAPDEDQAPPDVRQDRGRPYARGDYEDRANPYARDPYARDPYAARGGYDDPRAYPSDGGDEERGPPPRYGRGWRESPPPDYGDDGQAPPPRYQQRAPDSAADGDPRDGY